MLKPDKKSKRDDRLRILEEAYQQMLADPRRTESGYEFAWRKCRPIAEVLHNRKTELQRRMVRVLTHQMACEALDYAGSGAPRLEVMLACRVVCTEWAARTFEQRYYSPGTHEASLLEFMDRRIDTLNKRLQCGAVSFSKVRRARLAPTALVNVERLAAIVTTNGPAAIEEAKALGATVSMPLVNDEGFEYERVGAGES